VNKSELIEKVAGTANLSKSDAERAVNAFIGVVEAAVATDDKVTLPGFGAWSRTQRAARTGRNPRTGASSDPRGESREILSGCRFQEEGEHLRPSPSRIGLGASKPEKGR
jgi:DNA-binding protein HU-beta